MQRSIRVFHHLARTGGTLFSKCLGCMQNVVLLSEINPRHTSQFNPLWQANHWFALLTEDDLAMLNARGSMRFEDVIELINNRCCDRGLTLVIRDWTHLDFHGIPFVSPGYSLSLPGILETRFSVRAVHTVRHPLDHWYSLQRYVARYFPQARESLTPDFFLRGCLAYAEVSSQAPFYRYEDFTRDPDTVLGDMCDRLDIPFDPEYRNRWMNYAKITGDQAGPRSIQAARRRQGDAAVQTWFESRAAYHRILALWGYEP